ncbi:unnamed protein product [Adineta steineri]|uniref:Uncharacterized protein n=1 Tax=Adineta steineri TaxID=433720 RepID=A0A819SJ52_9BILA|nr:unnamed protein product [Adineta steineri]CAF3938993.1 unnamed protein product [Adineta steineri]CAF4065531.1 unnamed protein product [Adineta steineri]
MKEQVQVNENGSVYTYHIAIISTIINGECGFYGIYLPIYRIYTVIIIGTIPPIIMDIFGYLTCCNMRRVRGRIQPIVRNTIEGNVFLRQRDRDLLIIVIYEIFIYVIAASLYSLILLESLISDYAMLNKSVQYLQTENFILFLAFLLLTVNSSSPFFYLFKFIKNHFVKILNN